MENSMTAAALQQQQQQPQMQKKKKSKNKKGNKATLAEVGSTLEADSAKKPEFNENGLSEQLAHELHLSNTNNSSNHNNNNNRNNINSTASSDKLRKSNKLANGTAKKELSAPHQVNGHDNTGAAAALELTAETKLNGSPDAEMQHQQQQQQQQQSKKTKSKSKSNKQKHKESDKGNNCHKMCVNQKQSTQNETVGTITVHDQEHVETLKNGFCTAMDMDEVKEASSLKQNTNEDINKETQELLTNNKAAQAEQQQQPQQELKVATTPASTANSEAESAAKQDVSEEDVASPTLDLSNVQIEYKEYESELQMHDIMRLIQAELSEPYSIYTYRYFIYNWPKLCFLAAHGNEYVGAIVCKLDRHMNVKRGYIAMLAVRKEYRKLKIGTTLVQKAIEAMLADNADEVVLETEMRNLPALRLYENLGFVRDKRLFRYYLNGVDALRLKLWFR